MDETLVRALAEKFGVPETSVRVLNTLIEGNTFYDALQLRSQGITVDRVVELLATPLPVNELRKDLAAMPRVLRNSTTNPNVIADIYLGVIHEEPSIQELFDEIAWLPPRRLTADNIVYLSEVDGREGRILPNLLWGDYRNNPSDAEHFYEHLASQG